MAPFPQHPTLFILISLPGATRITYTPALSGRQQAELGKTRGSSQSVHSTRRAFQMHGGASEGDALRRLMRRVHSTSTWVHLSPRCSSDRPPISHHAEFQHRSDGLEFVKSTKRKQRNEPENVLISFSRL